MCPSGLCPELSPICCALTHEQVMGSGKQHVAVDEQEERLGHVFSQREKIIIVGLKILRKMFHWRRVGHQVF